MGEAEHSAGVPYTRATHFAECKKEKMAEAGKQKRKA